MIDERKDWHKDWSDEDFIAEGERRILQTIGSHNPMPFEWAEVFRLATIGASVKLGHVIVPKELAEMLKDTLPFFTVSHDIRCDCPYCSALRKLRWDCDCGAAIDGKWADIHSPNCSSMLSALPQPEPTPNPKPFTKKEALAAKGKTTFK